MGDTIHAHARMTMTEMRMGSTRAGINKGVSGALCTRGRGRCGRMSTHATRRDRMRLFCAKTAVDAQYETVIHLVYVPVGDWILTDDSVC